MDSTYILFNKMTTRDFVINTLEEFNLYFSSPKTTDLRLVRLKAAIEDERVKNLLEFLETNNIKQFQDYTFE